MTATHYSNGYGIREKPPECIEEPHLIDCPCCQGAGEHEFGHGMDADGVVCSLCRGEGQVSLRHKPDPTEFQRGKTAGRNLAHSSLRLWKPGSHAPGCDCQVCRTAAAIIAKAHTAPERRSTAPAMAAD